MGARTDRHARMHEEMGCRTWIMGARSSVSYSTSWYENLSQGQQASHFFLTALTEGVSRTPPHRHIHSHTNKFTHARTRAQTNTSSSSSSSSSFDNAQYRTRGKYGTWELECRGQRPPGGLYGRHFPIFHQIRDDKNSAPRYAGVAVHHDFPPAY